MWLIYAREFCGMPKPDTFLLFLNYDQDLVIFFHIYVFIRDPIHKIFLIIHVGYRNDYDLVYKFYR